MMFVLFCWLFRWQPFHTRLHLPVLVAWSPVVAVVGERALRRGATALAVILMVGSLPWIVYNETRPILSHRSIFTTPRLDQYFAAAEHDAEPYRRAVALLRADGCRQVGFIGNENAAEYPLWVLLRDGAAPAVRIEHVLVRDESARFSTRPPFSTFEPCAIFHVGPDSRHALATPWGEFRRYWSSGSVEMYTVALYRPG